MTILNKILLEKKLEVTNLKTQIIEQVSHKDIIPFSERVRASEKMSIIAEFKRASPSKGAIQLALDPAAQAKEYDALGAAAISVLTDTPFFQGSMDDLRAVRRAVDLPILCKDFIIDTIQIDHAKSAGANIILLIVAALDDTDLHAFYRYATDLNLEVLVEVHNESEMERALELGAEIIGINNRNLKTFDVDLETTKKLASMVTNPNTILVSESGINTHSDALQVAESNANVILVGETLMRATNLQTKLESLQVPLKGRA